MVSTGSMSHDTMSNSQYRPTVGARTASGPVWFWRIFTGSGGSVAAGRVPEAYSGCRTFFPADPATGDPSHGIDTGVTSLNCLPRVGI
jgi:hypothetical protein